jgi:hypothetical protein
MRPPSLRIGWRVATAIVAGILAGSVLITPAVGHIASIAHTWSKHFQPLADQRYVRKAQTQTGFVSCPAVAWQEASNTMLYDETANLRFIGAPAASGRFHCPIALPHGANLTTARYGIRDANPTEALSCTVTRRPLLGDAGGIEMATANSDFISMPGDVQLTGTFSGATVDNGTFSYSVTCFIIGNGTDIGIYGASIEYTITGAKGAAS